MTKWLLPELLGCQAAAPSALRELATELVQICSQIAREGYPQVEGLLEPDGDGEVEHATVLIAIAPGVTLEMEWRDADDGHLSDPSARERWIGEKVAIGIPAISPSSDVLEKAVLAARREARGLVADWQAMGLPAELAHVHLAPLDRWSATTPEVSIGLVGLNDRLLPGVGTFRAAGTDAIRTEAQAGFEQLRRRAGMRIALGREGASGEVSLLASRVIARHRPLKAVLRELADTSVLWLTRDDAVRWRDGRIEVLKRDFDNGVSWLGDRIVIEGLRLSDDAARELVGRPVTKVARHALLDDRMVIEAVEGKQSDGRPRESFKVTMPHLYFCAMSGETW